MQAGIRGGSGTLALVVAAVCACSSSSGTGSGPLDAAAEHEGLDASAGDSGVAALCSGPPWNNAEAGPKCASSFPMQGGLTFTLSATGCGYDASGGGEVTWSEADASLGWTIEVAFHSSPPIQPDQTGTIPVDVITVREYTDAGAIVWATPAGACSVTVATTTCLRDDLDPSQHDIFFKGSGSCTQPAAPQGTNTGAPVTLGAFTFQGYTPCIDSRGFAC